MSLTSRWVGSIGKPCGNRVIGLSYRSGATSATASSAPRLRHLPSGYPQVNLAWMWGALLAATMAAWLHQLTAVTAGEDIIYGHGVRGGKAMIATLRRRLIAVRGGLVRHARHLVLRLPPGTACFPRSWPG